MKAKPNLITEITKKTCITLQSNIKEPSLIVSILYKVLVTVKQIAEYYILVTEMFKRPIMS